MKKKLIRIFSENVALKSFKAQKIKRKIKFKEFF